MLKHARLRLYQHYLHPYQRRSRERRSHWLKEVIGLRPSMRVIDLGGAPMLWQFVDVPLNITLLNLVHTPEAMNDARIMPQHKFTFEIGDACNLDWPSNSYDLVFSNSVIEHVGDKARRAAFASHARRLAEKYWVQTPAKYFPIEAHTGMPFWWYYPESTRQSLRDKWRKELPPWTEMIDGTTLVERPELEDIFPDATISPERAFGIVKSYVAFRA